MGDLHTDDFICNWTQQMSMGSELHRGKSHLPLPHKHYKMKRVISLVLKSVNLVQAVFSGIKV